MRYYIACDSRYENKQLLLVDRRKTKAQFWTEEFLNIAMAFENYAAAKKAVSKLRYNNPRIINQKEASDIAWENCLKNAMNE